MRAARRLGLVVMVAAVAVAGAEEGKTVPVTFDSPPAGWQLEDAGERGAAVRDGALVVWVDNSARPYQPMTVRVPGEHGAVTVEVDARKSSGAPSTGIGLVCRDGEQGRYFADVDARGDVRLGANLKGQGQKVLAKTSRPGVWREGVNRLRLDCLAGELAFSVNGERVLSATDARLASGTVGLRAGGAGSERTEVAFDNLVVTPR